jgi:magnesium chelatase family protein
MSLAVVRSRGLVGVEAPSVSVEVHLANGLPAFHIVGLPDTEVRESRERVRAALLQEGFEFPNRRITVNLAPADLPKGSGRFDLPAQASRRKYSSESN